MLEGVYLLTGLSLFLFRGVKGVERWVWAFGLGFIVVGLALLLFPPEGYWAPFLEFLPVALAVLLLGPGGKA